MKNERGITLMALVIQVATLIIILSILSNANVSFIKNYKKLNNNGENLVEFNRFNMVLLNDVKKENTKIIDPVGEFENQTTIRFRTGVEYTYNSEEKTIYRNTNKVCEGVSDCKFSKELQVQNNTSKEILKVYLKIGDENIYEKTISYVLRYY